MTSHDLRLVEGSPLRCLLSLPEHPSPAAAGARPVPCFVLGYDEAASMDIRRALTLHGPLRPGIPATAPRDFVVGAPQLPVAGELRYQF